MKIVLAFNCMERLCQCRFARMRRGFARFVRGMIHPGFQRRSVGATPLTFAIHGLAVARGIAMGRAVLVASSRVDVAHYFIEPTQVASEIDRVRVGRNTVVEEIRRLQVNVSQMGPKEAPHELARKTAAPKNSTHRPRRPPQRA